MAAKAQKLDNHSGIRQGVASMVLAMTMAAMPLAANAEHATADADADRNLLRSIYPFP